MNATTKGLLAALGLTVITASVTLPRPTSAEYSPTAIENTLANHESRIKTLEVTTPTPSPAVPTTNTVYIEPPPTPSPSPVATPQPSQSPGDAAKNPQPTFSNPTATPEPSHNNCIEKDSTGTYQQVDCTTIR